jgi:hypothetical protein
MNESEATTTSYNQPREWLLWTVATTGGWLLGAVFNLLLSIVLSMTGLGNAFNADPAEVPQSMILLLMGVSLGLLFVMGVSIGALQWLVLRRHLPSLQRWAIFTGLGFALGTFAFLAFMGLGAGLLQWLLLRRDLNKTGWWPVMSAVAWPVAYMLGGGLGVTVGIAIGSPLLGNLLSAALTGIIVGALTGAVLLWILRENAVLLEGLRQDREAEQAKQ